MTPEDVIHKEEKVSENILGIPIEWSDIEFNDIIFESLTHSTKITPILEATGSRNSVEFIF